MKFIKRIDDLRSSLDGCSKGVFDPAVEQRIRTNVLNICSKVYSRYAGYVEKQVPIPDPKNKYSEFEGKPNRLALSFQMLLNDLSQDWSKEFALECTHGKTDDAEKSLVKLSTLDRVQLIFNSEFANK